MEIYLDNASTSFPKPNNVISSIQNYMLNIGGNSGRGLNTNSLSTNNIIYETRELLAEFFNFNKSSNVIFTNNVTTSLNLIINGLFKKGDHVITTCFEHNSVIRPLTALVEKEIITLDIISPYNGFNITNDDLRSYIKPNTKAFILSHSSNVIGCTQNIKSLGECCRDNNIFFILDSAQTAGSKSINVKECNINALAFTGHKNLLGPQGIGGFLIDDSLNENCASIFSGGTGSNSSLLTQPTFLPDKFEYGTLNSPGVVGLKASIEFINRIGLDEISYKTNNLRTKLYNGLKNIDSAIVYGNNDNYTSTLSFNIKNSDPSEVSFNLSELGIANRSGLHCSPLAHKFIDTYPTGTVRLSPGFFNSDNDIDYTLKIINSL